MGKFGGLFSPSIAALITIILFARAPQVRADEPPPPASTQPSLDPPEVDGDPMDWHPGADPPALRQVLDPVTYEQRFKAALQKINLKSLRDPSRPTEGEMVFLVLPGSPAEKLGIKPGDIVTVVDGVAVGPRSGEIDGLSPPPDGKRSISFWSPDRGETTAETDARRFGYWYWGGVRPAESYARSNQRDPRWDDQVLVAAANFVDDPDLAETALLHAQQAGFDGQFLYTLAAKIAFQQFRFDDAVAFGWHLLSSGRPMGKDLAVTLSQAALLDFKLEQSLELVRRFPDVIPAEPEVAELVKAYRALPPDKGPNPIARMAHLKRNRIKSFAPFVPPGEPDISSGFSQWAADTINHQHKVNVEIPSEHYNLYLLKPAFANVAVTVHFQLHDPDGQLARNPKNIAFGLFDTTQPLVNHHLPERSSVKAYVSYCQEMSIWAFGLPSQLLLTPPPHVPWHCQGTLRMVILHDRCEVTLDGRRVFYGPVVAPESTRRYGLWIQVIGMSGRIDEPVVEELIDSSTSPT